jgi:hypothetical protein
MKESKRSRKRESVRGIREMRAKEEENSLKTHVRCI